MGIIVDGLVWLINACYSLCKNYWVAIFLFTLLTKIILLPLSVIVQKNSIKQVKMLPDTNRIKAKYMGNSEIISEEQYKLFKKYKYSPFIDIIPMLIQLALLMGVVEAVKKGTPLTDVPMEVKGLTLLVPVIAGISAFFMCYAQNKANVLQSEQSNWNKYGTLTFSVALSLYLGLFVAVGVGTYWIFSNLLSIAQLLLLNIAINPKNYIDYEDLEKSKEELANAKQYASSKGKEKRSKEVIQREKADYKKFLAVPKVKIVFYSEKNGFYKYYKNIIEEIIRRTNIVVHYITSDPADEVFSMESNQFKPYYIGENRMIVLMMKLEADIVVMTTPDLENYQLKRSYVKKDAIYVYVPHDVNSSNLTFHKNALDHFDVIFTSGFKNKNELLEREEKFNLNKKEFVEWGSSVIDNMIKSYEAMEKEDEESGKNSGEKTDKKTVLIAPSWQKDNIMDSYIESMLEQLKNTPYNIIVRPHPQYVRHYESRIDALAEKYKADGIVFQKDFSSNKTVYTADLLVTDWSSIAFEYTFSTLKPVLFINTPMKVVNPDYQELSEVPIDIELRDKIGISVDTDKIDGLNTAVDTLLFDERFSKQSIAELRDKYIYNIGTSGKVGAMYLINRLLAKEKK